MLRRDIRYQAAILRDHHVLLLYIVESDGTTFWVQPGGGREAEETAEACVSREVFEETSLTVEVERFLFAEPEVPRVTYDFRHTFQCRVLSGTTQIGAHPACDATIRGVGWFDLREPAGWPSLILTDSITGVWLEKLREALGYS